MDVKGKKLLVLGGIALSREIIKQAHKQGVYVIVTDYLENSPGKKIADKSFMISVQDVDAVVNLIQKEKIDGVLTGFVESVFPYYQLICKKAGLPCYATEEQVKITTNKAEFSKLCRNFDISVIQEYQIRYPFSIKEAGHIDYPVLLKPVDNSGSRGIFVCNGPADLVDNYKKSLTFSPSKKVLIQKYMNADEGSIYYVIQNGEIYLSAIADKFKYEENGINPIPFFFSFPSKHLENYQKNHNPKVIEMFKSIGIQNGVLCINSFFENNNFFPFDIGFRLAGGLEYKIISKLNGINPLEMLINYALTGSMWDESIRNLINPNLSEWGCNITLLAKPGQVGNIIGLNEVNLLKGLIDVVPIYGIGDIIPPSAIGTHQQDFIKIFATAKTREEMLEFLHKVINLIRVFSTEGENMLYDLLDTKDMLDLHMPI